MNHDRAHSNVSSLHSAETPINKMRLYSAKPILHVNRDYVSAKIPTQESSTPLLTPHNNPNRATHHGDIHLQLSPTHEKHKHRIVELGKSKKGTLPLAFISSTSKWNIVRKMFYDKLEKLR